MNKDGRGIQTLAALVLLAAFAVGLLAALLGGANAYRSLTARGRKAYDSRTAAGYFTARARQALAVELESFAGGQALNVYQDTEGFVTRIYCYDGWLMELFCLAGEDFDPQDGERVMPLEALSMTLEDRLLTVELCCGGVEQRFCLEVAP